MRTCIRVILSVMLLFSTFRVVFSAVNSLSEVPKWYVIIGDSNLIDSIKVNAYETAKEKYCEYYALNVCANDDCLDQCDLECSIDDNFDCFKESEREGFIVDPGCHVSSSTQSDCANCLSQCESTCYDDRYPNCVNTSQLSDFLKVDCLKKLHPFYEGKSYCDDLKVEYYMAALMKEIEDTYDSGMVILNRSDLKILVASNFPTSAPWGSFELKVGSSTLYNEINNRYYEGSISVGNITLKYGYLDYDYKCVAGCTGNCPPGKECLKTHNYCYNDGKVYETQNECNNNCVCTCECKPVTITPIDNEGSNEGSSGESGSSGSGSGSGGGPGGGSGSSQTMEASKKFLISKFFLPEDIVFSTTNPSNQFSSTSSNSNCTGYASCQEILDKYVNSSVILKYYVVPCDSSSDCPGNSFCIKNGLLDFPENILIKVRREFQNSSINLQSNEESYSIPVKISTGFCNYDPKNGKVVGLDVDTSGSVISTEGIYLTTANGKLYVDYNNSIFGKYEAYGCIPGTYEKLNPYGNSTGCCYQNECWSDSGCVPAGTVLNLGGTKYYCSEQGTWYILGSCYDAYGITCPVDKPYYLPDTNDGCYNRNEFESIADSYINKTCYSSIVMKNVGGSCIKGIVVNDNLMNSFECCPENTCAYNLGCYSVGSWVNHTDGRNYICWSNLIWRDPDKEEQICKALGYNYSTTVDWCFMKDNTGRYYCADQSQYKSSDVNIPSCCGDDPNEEWDCSPLDPNDCGCVPKGYCYHNNKVYAPGSGFYNFYYDKTNITNRTIEYWKCVNGNWEKEDLGTNPSLCSPYAVVLNATIGEGIFPAYIVNITGNGQFDVLLGKFAEYKGNDSLDVGSFVTKNARIESIIPISIEGTGSDVKVRWSFMAYVYQGNGGMCCGDQGNESLGNRVCVPANGNIPYLTCDSSPFDYTCLSLSEGGPVNCEEVCNKTHLGYKCTQECETYNDTIPGILYCVYDGNIYPPGSILLRERMVNYGIENVTVSILPYYHMYSSYGGISNSPFVTGVPIYRGNATFIYNKTEDKLKVSFSEKRKYIIVCVNGIWYGSCGNGYCEKDLGENARTCPEDCCTRDCIDESTNETNLLCVGFNGCSLPRGCLEGMKSTCILPINTTSPVKNSYCSGDICSWVNYSGFNIIGTGAVYDCKKDEISDCGEVAIGATIMKYFRYSPYVSLLDWNVLSKGITVDTQCVERGRKAYCKIIDSSFDSDKLKEVCEALKGIWLENNFYCNKTYQHLNLKSCCCGDDIGEIPYEEKYIDFLGRLDTGRFYCHSNPLYCHFELENGTFIDVAPGGKINITIEPVSSLGDFGNCNLTRYFESAFKFILGDKNYESIYRSELSNCYDKVNYTVIYNNNNKKYDLKDEIYLKVGNMTKVSTLFNATLFPGIYRCDRGYFILEDVPSFLKEALLNVSEVTLKSESYPIKLSYGVNWTYSFGEGVGESLGRVETPYVRRYTQQEVEGWK